MERVIWDFVSRNSFQLRPAELFTFTEICFLPIVHLLVVFRPRLSFAACGGCLAVCYTLHLPVSRDPPCLQPGQKTESQSHLHSRRKWVITSTSVALMSSHHASVIVAVELRRSIWLVISQ